MYRIEDFVEYDGQKLNSGHAVLTWCKGVGYQFMMNNNVKEHHTIVGYRP